MKKILGLIGILIVGYVLPLLWKVQLISHPFILLLMLACIVIILTQPALDSKEDKRVKHSDKHSFWVIYLLAIIGVTAPIIEWAYFKPLHSDFNWITILGIVLLLAGLGIRVWAIQVLGKFFTATVQIKPDHQLIQVGPYQMLRHPSYFGAFIGYIACGLILNAFVGTLLAALAMFIAYYYRITTEEKTLLLHFGEQYEKYQRNSWRMLPGIW